MQRGGISWLRTRASRGERVRDPARAVIARRGRWRDWHFRPFSTVLSETRTGARAPILAFSCTLRTSHGRQYSLYGHHKPHSDIITRHHHAAWSSGSWAHLARESRAYRDLSCWYARITRARPLPSPAPARKRSIQPLTRQDRHLLPAALLLGARDLRSTKQSSQKQPQKQEKERAAHHTVVMHARASSSTPRCPR